MIRYELRLKAQEPLMLGQAQALGNYRASEEIIPGRALRGALAAVLQQNNPPLFEALFNDSLAESAHFGPLFPALNSEGAGPRLSTLLTCKYHGGEPNSSDIGEKKHGVFDGLVRQFALGVACDNDPLPAALDELRCKVCDAPTEHADVFPARPRRVSTTHVAINRRRRIAEDGRLYVREGTALNDEGKYYIGWIDVPAAQTSALSEALVAGTRLRIGGNRSRGMGLVTINSYNELKPASGHAVADRIRLLNQKIQAALRFYSAQTKIQYPELNAAMENRYFTIDLRGDAVLLQDGLSATDPDLSALSGVVVRRWIDWRVVGGWHAAARLPRQTQLAVSGVYLCRFDAKPDMNALAKLENDGIGILREQGFGQISICHPIHEATGL